MAFQPPEEHQEALEDVPEVVVALDGCERVHHKIAKQLHPDDCVDEKEHPHQHADVGQRLEGLYEGVEQDPDTDAPSQQLDQPGGTEKLQEPDLEQLGHIDNASHNSDEIKCVP
jgi:hypothetical protein